MFYVNAVVNGMVLVIRADSCTLHGAVLDFVVLTTAVAWP